MTNTDKRLEEFKTLRTLNGSEAEAILEDGTRLSEWIATSIQQAIAEDREMMMGEIEKVKFTICDGDIKREVVGLEDITNILKK